MKIRDIIKAKGPTVYSIDPDSFVSDAIEMLVRHGIGSLLVVEDSVPLGIFTERDTLRVCHTDAHRLGEIPVRDIMSTELIVGRLDDDVEDVMSVMTEKRIRHIPIVEKHGAIAGLVSIGDIVKSQLHEHATTVRYLKDYITGNDIR